MGKKDKIKEMVKLADTIISLTFEIGGLYEIYTG